MNERMKYRNPKQDKHSTDSYLHVGLNGMQQCWNNGRVGQEGSRTIGGTAQQALVEERCSQAQSSSCCAGRRWGGGGGGRGARQPPMLLHQPRHRAQKCECLAWRRMESDNDYWKFCLFWTVFFIYLSVSFSYLFKYDVIHVEQVYKQSRREQFRNPYEEKNHIVTMWMLISDTRKFGLQNMRYLQLAQHSFEHLWHFIVSSIRSNFRFFFLFWGKG